MAIEKIKILGAIWPIFAVNRLNWHCCLAGSSRIFIFSMAMGADYSFELISIQTYAPQFIGHNKLFLGSVSIMQGRKKI